MTRTHLDVSVVCRNVKSQHFILDSGLNKSQCLGVILLLPLTLRLQVCDFTSRVSKQMAQNDSFELVITHFLSSRILDGSQSLPTVMSLYCGVSLRVRVCCL